MSWNNAYETKKFEARQKKQADEYRVSGMAEEQIQAMYEFDLEQFSSERRYREHTQAFIPDDFDEDKDDEEKLSIFEKFQAVLTVSIEDSGVKSRYWWIEEIEDAEQYKRIKLLNPEDIELITRYVYDGYTQDEIAKQYSCTKQNIQKKFRRIKKSLS